MHACMQLAVRGLQGGHSGLQIDQGLGNAVQLLASALSAVTQAALGARVARVDGGDKRNAIAREANALLLVGCGGWGRF